MASLVSESAPGLIGGHFAIDFSTQVTELSGGQPAYASHSAQMGPGFMAVQVALGWPARPRPLAALSAAPIANLLVPQAHGPAGLPSGETGYFVVCHAPTGRPVSSDLHPWSEAELMDLLIRPASVVLADLHGRGVTHRAIRPSNAFRAGPADAVTLGCGWAAPPASTQPCVSEPPYVAQCLPSARGEGTPPDDIYALGVLLITLALGRDPMAGLDDAAIIRSKLDQGSFAAIVGRHRLPNAVVELARGMLADDPEHRPSAVLLGDPAAARARRATARPPRLAQRALTIGDKPALTARELALSVMSFPDQAAAQLRSGAVGVWLRRGVGDGEMASKVDELVSQREDASMTDEPRADALLACRAVAVLDPLAPMAWRRIVLWPDGLGPALNQALQAEPALAMTLAEIATHDVAMAFATLRPARIDLAAVRTTTRQIRGCLAVKQPVLGALRMNYALNPLAPCESPLLAGRWVTTLAELLPALEIAAAGPLRAKLPPIDDHIVAFIGVRRDERDQADLGQLANLVNPADPMSQLRLLARLQFHTESEKLPALTAWLAELVGGATARFHSVSQRTKLTQQLAELAKLGTLPAIAALLDDPARLAADTAGYQAAIVRSGEIDAEINALRSALTPARTAASMAVHNVVNGISLAACGIALAAAVFL